MKIYKVKQYPERMRHPNDIPVGGEVGYTGRHINDIYTPIRPFWCTSVWGHAIDKGRCKFCGYRKKV